MMMIRQRNLELMLVSCSELEAAHSLASDLNFQPAACAAHFSVSPLRHIYLIAHHRRPAFEPTRTEVMQLLQARLCGAMTLCEGRMVVKCKSRNMSHDN